MQKYCLAFVLALSLSVGAYDFDDVDFNAYLLEDLQFHDSELAFAAARRSRRDAEVVTPPETTAGQNAPKDSCTGRREWKKEMLCCKGDKIDHEQLESFKELKKQCHAQVRGNNSDDSFDPFDCDKMQQVKQQVVCISECFATKLNLVDEHGVLLREPILVQTRAKIGDIKWKQDAAERFVDKCLSEVKEKQAKSEVGGCNRASLDFHHCIWREYLNGCPADQRLDTPKCNKIRERAAKGDTSFLNKRLLHHFHHSRHEESN